MWIITSTEPISRVKRLGRRRRADGVEEEMPWKSKGRVWRSEKESFKVGGIKGLVPLIGLLIEIIGLVPAFVNLQRLCLLMAEFVDISYVMYRLAVTHWHFSDIVWKILSTKTPLNRWVHLLFTICPLCLDLCHHLFCFTYLPLFGWRRCDSVDVINTSEDTVKDYVANRFAHLTAGGEISIRGLIVSREGLVMQGFSRLNP